MIVIARQVASLAALCVCLVLLSGCAVRSALLLRATVVMAPIVEKLSAVEGSLTGGETITIEGSHLDTVDRVMFGGQLAESVVSVDSSHVNVLVPHSDSYPPGRCRSLSPPLAAFSRCSGPR